MRIPTIGQYIISGVLMGVSFVHPYLWWCFIPGFVLLLILTDCERTYKKLFLYGWLVGVLRMSGALLWFWSTFPMVRFDEHTLLQIGVIGAYWLISAVVMGLPVGVVLLLYKRYRRYLLIAPFLWVAAELCGAFLFSLYAYGDGGTLNSNFSFGYLGYALSAHPLFLPCARFGGVFVLSFIAVALCVCFYYAARGTTRVKVIATVVFVLLCGSSFVVHTSDAYTPKLGLHVISIETNFDDYFFTEPDAYTRKATQVKAAVAQALQEHPDVVILPEDSRLIDNFDSARALFNWASTSDAVIVDSGRMIDERGITVLRAHLFNLRTDEVYAIDKQYLVPQGEYMPTLHGAILKRFVAPHVLHILDDQDAYRPGAVQDSSVIPSDLPGVLFCFGSVDPQGTYDAYKTRRPPFIAHVVSHGWFHQSRILQYQLDQMLRVQSVWQRVSIVSATNMAENTFYTPHGALVHMPAHDIHTHWRLRTVQL